MTKMHFFSFAVHGRVYIPVHFKPYGDTIMRAVHMKVDTGADLTTLSKEKLYDLGYDSEWIKENAITGDKYNLITAAGDIEIVGLVQIPLVNILGYEADNWPFRIAMDEKRDFHNLLGRDLLAGFDYTFRNSTAQFEISRNGNFTPLYDFIAGQSINETKTR